MNPQNPSNMEAKVQAAIERLRAFEPPDGYFLGFSGGKDSQCIYHLAIEAGVQFEAHLTMTSLDPPEVISFVQTQYPDVILDEPPETMWDLIVRKKIPPTRKIRYCCMYKERSGKGRTVVTGVRWAESARRKNTRAMLELNAYTKKKMVRNDSGEETRWLFDARNPKSKHILNPIVDWELEDVWAYLNGNNIPHCCLYDEGHRRIGCIGCPMQREKGMLRDFARWPQYYDAFLRTFERMLENRRASGLTCGLWPDAQAVMDWWIYGKAHLLRQREDIARKLPQREQADASDGE